MPTSELAAEVKRIREQVEKLVTKSEEVESKIAKDLLDLRHDHASIRGAVLAVLDSLDEVDRRLEAQAAKVPGA
jgi:hypothetical protein